VASVTRCGGRDRIGRYAAAGEATPNPPHHALGRAEGLSLVNDQPARHGGAGYRAEHDALRALHHQLRLVAPIVKKVRRGVATQRQLKSLGLSWRARGRGERRDPRGTAARNLG
jgi:hypothetical protein